MCEAGVAVRTMVGALATVEVHVIDEGGFLSEGLIAEGALVALASPSVHGHVSREVGGVVELLGAARAGVDGVGGAGVDS